MPFVAQFAFAFVQDRVRLAQFFQAGNHREHDLDVADGAGAKDRAQLCLEDIEVLQAEPDGAQTQETDSCSSPDVERAGASLSPPRSNVRMMSGCGSTRSRHAPIRFVLLLFALAAWPGSDKEIPSGKVRSLPRRLRTDRFDIVRQLDVGRKNNVAAVARGRFGFAKSRQLLRHRLFPALNSP